MLAVEERESSCEHRGANGAEMPQDGLRGGGRIAPAHGRSGGRHTTGQRPFASKKQGVAVAVTQCGADLRGRSHPAPGHVENGESGAALEPGVAGQRVLRQVEDVQGAQRVELHPRDVVPAGRQLRQRGAAPHSIDLREEVAVEEKHAELLQPPDGVRRVEPVVSRRKLSKGAQRLNAIECPEVARVQDDPGQRGQRPGVKRRA